MGSEIIEVVERRRRRPIEVRLRILDEGPAAWRLGGGGRRPAWRCARPLSVAAAGARWADAGDVAHACSAATFAPVSIVPEGGDGSRDKPSPTPPALAAHAAPTSKRRSGAVEITLANGRRDTGGCRKARGSIQRELAATEREIELVMQAVTDGAPTSVTMPKLNALAARKQELESQLAQAARPDVVELHPQAALSYAAQVAAIHEALTAGDAAGLDAVRLVRELVTEIRVTPTPAL